MPEICPEVVRSISAAFSDVSTHKSYEKLITANHSSTDLSCAFVLVWVQAAQAVIWTYSVQLQLDTLVS